MNQLPAKVSESFKRINPKIYAKSIAHRKVSYPQPERHKTSALGAAIPGGTESIPRTTVRFTGYRVRPLDPDNFAGGIKDLLDGLRHAKLIHGDEAWRTKLETEQVKVAHYEDEYTLIEIETSTKN